MQGYVMLFFILVSLGLAAITSGKWYLGVPALLAAALLAWSWIQALKPTTYPYSTDDCPCQGQMPVYGWFKSGYHYNDTYSPDDEGRTLASCTHCGFHQVLGRSSAVTSGLLGHRNQLPVHP